MNGYLELLNTLRISTELSKHTGSEFSEMDIIYIEALLMGAGSETLKSVKSGELAAILSGLVVVAYTALETLAIRKATTIDHSAESTDDYLMITIMRRLAQKIADCASGSPKDYSALFNYCAHLATDFINADFEAALKIYHQWRIALTNASTDYLNVPLPDFTDCLFE